MGDQPVTISLPTENNTTSEKNVEHVHALSEIQTQNPCVQTGTVYFIDSMATVTCSYMFRFMKSLFHQIPSIKLIISSRMSSVSFVSASVESLNMTSHSSVLCLGLAVFSLYFYSFINPIFQNPTMM